ncbi:hypothetical protein E3N88_37716 [Mikania micrantha]|uniref:Leucine-rich repeat-containing N-terminal plant-type domain-containing protein n=1 Tax=Mikania micrantha TaxID=192012 RepID=A0A5N6LRZ9_9ASTR|nr:hypothetical protein E3N88_37716 [Mikania micrantha]
MMLSSSNTTCIKEERESLLRLKQSLANSLNRLSTWSGVECCEWQGVECDKQIGHVVKLDLRNTFPFVDKALFNGNQLGGELNPSLLNLKHLRYLDLSMNNLSGNIPKFLGSFERLEYLNLSWSGLGGVVPHHLGNLSRLQVLDLNVHRVLDRYGLHSPYFDDSFLVVDDLQWVSSLSSLYHLDLSGTTIGNDIDWFHPVNKLTSLLNLKLASCDITIDSIKFINFTSLNSLDLSYNDIDSTIPIWLSNLTSLTHLHLKDNSFHGPIPDFLGKMITLASIGLSENYFINSIPDLFSNLSSLVYLDLSANKFNGSFPPDMKLCNLGVLDLSWNQYTEDLADFVGNMSDCMLNSLKVLIFENNMFKGRVPSKLGDFTKLEHLLLSVNTLDGPIPPSLGGLSSLRELDTQWVPPFQLKRFEASSCNIGPRFPNWLQTQTNLSVLDLSNSSIKDTIPEWFENFSFRCDVVLLSHNQISGKLPPFHGSTTDRILMLNSNKFEGRFTSFPSNLQLLDVSDNLLSGQVPHTDGTMNPSLEVINLSKNRFTGSIPVHLCKVLSINVLDLSQNKFSGRFPECIENLISLQVIDLSNNTIAGVVPSLLGSLTQLKSLHLHNNRFEGNLPLSLQNLTGLVTMDFGYNLLTGRIPFWNGENLSNLRILNLQSNKLTGKIPLQLCQLNGLLQLNLALNNITGTIPRCFGNFSFMTMISDQVKFVYTVRNEGLCGPPVSRSCNGGTGSSYYHADEDEAQDDDDDEGLWFYVGMGPGFVVGFVGLLGSLHFIKRWRVAYFEMLENVYRWVKTK